MKVPLKNPQPDAENFKQVIRRNKIPERVHFAELHIDKEIIAHITENILKREWIEPSDERKTREEYLKNYIECWYRLGYDYVRLTGDFRFSAGLSFASKVRTGQDTALISRGTRTWTEQAAGMISSWEDFEEYPWPSLEDVNLWALEFAAKNLPEGMGIFACPCQGIFEAVSNSILGYENLAFLLYDNPRLVETVFERVGRLIYDYYKKIIGLENMIGFFQGDDIGFRTSTLIHPDDLRKYVFPWHKKIAQLAHEHDLLYVLHSCGYSENIMEDLIEDVKIDAKHSFEDEIMPVTEFKKKYGNKLAVLGGVDVDKLVRLPEDKLRKYVRDILDECMPLGYALGSGNSITNYMPVENYLAMLDEGVRWSG